MIQTTKGLIPESDLRRITYRDGSGAATQCGKSFTANAQWRVVRRKR